MHCLKEELKVMKTQPTGGSIVNAASTAGLVGLEGHGAYCASKHAIKGFTNALRMELTSSAPDISVTLIKPAAIDTPYHLHARNYTGGPKKNPPPVYSVTLVAEAILHAAEHRTRQLTVGGGGRALTVLGHYLPALAEPLYAFAVPLLMKGPSDCGTGEDEALYKAGRGMHERAPYFGVRQTSLYAAALMNSRRTAAVIAGALAAGLVILKARESLRLMSAGHDAVRRYKARLDAKAERQAAE